MNTPRFKTVAALYFIFLFLFFIMMLFIVQNTHQMGFLGRTLIQKTLFSFYVFLISFNLACPEKPRLWSQSLVHICPNESAGGGMHHAVLKLQDLTFFWLVVARVRVSPFSQLNLHESDETKVVLKKQKHSVSMARPKNTN